MKKVIGITTTYTGTEHGYMKGYKVRIVAILKNAADPDYDHISDDLDLERAGGVTIHDRIEVAPWIEKEGRFSWVTSDPKAIDLACFKKLAKLSD